MTLPLPVSMEVLDPETRAPCKSVIELVTASAPPDSLMPLPEPPETDPLTVTEKFPPREALSACLACIPWRVPSTSAAAI